MTKQLFLVGFGCWFVGFLCCYFITLIGSRPRPTIAPYRGPGRRATDPPGVAIGRPDKDVDKGIELYERARRREGFGRNESAPEDFVLPDPVKVPKPLYYREPVAVPPVPPWGYGGEAPGALRAIHDMEQTPAFEYDVQCPECNAIAPAGFRIMEHAADCSKTRELERIL